MFRNRIFLTVVAIVAAIWLSLGIYTAANAQRMNTNMEQLADDAR